MTQGETLFYLREIHSHWGPSNVSSEKLAELEAARLIESNGEPIPQVRLTSEGSRRKMVGRHHSMVDGISLTANTRNGPRNGPRNNRPNRNRTPRKRLPQARPLV